MNKYGLIIEGLNNNRNSAVNEAKELKYDDVSNMRVFKKDEDSAVVIFKYDGKNIMQGYDEKHEVNLELTDEGLKGVLEVLKDQGFEEVSVSEDDIQKQYEKITNESYIEEKVGDRHKAADKESDQERTLKNRKADRSANRAIAVGSIIGTHAVIAAGTGALTKAVAAKFGTTAGMLVAGGGKSVAAKALAVKVCTAIPMSTFGGLALAGVGCAVAGAVVATRIMKKREKERENANADFKTAWGKYYKRDGNDWVQIKKEEYYKLSGKDK